jgi:hypothetical protein
MEPPMTHQVRLKLVSRVITVAAVFAALTANTLADAINFLDMGSLETQSLDVGGMTISGSNPVVVSPNAGLTILGGLPGIGIGGPDHTIDPTESVTFRFDNGPATKILLSRLFAGAFGNTSTTAQGESLISAFGLAGNSLGTVDLIPGPAFNISAAFGDQPISSFTLQPKGDSVNGSDITLSELTYNTVPEPVSLLGWAAGVLVLFRRTRKARKPATKARIASHNRD